jgi:hypothetical protein
VLELLQHHDAAPSPSTNPSRVASNGREAVARDRRCASDSACMFAKPRHRHRASPTASDAAADHDVARRRTARRRNEIADRRARTTAHGRTPSAKFGPFGLEAASRRRPQRRR